MLTDKQEKQLKRYLRETPPEDVAYGWVTEINRQFSPGMYRILPLLARLAALQNEEQKPDHLIVYGSVLKVYDTDHLGDVSWKVPLTPRMIPEALRLLAALGWNGKVWPRDGGWPDQPNEIRGLQRLLREIGLTNTLSFPPDAKLGNRVLRFMMPKRNALFPLPINLSEEDVVEVTPELEEEFRRLMESPDSLFGVSLVPSKQPTPESPKESAPDEPKLV